MATIERYETQTGTRYMVRYRAPSGAQTKKRGFTRKRDAVEFANTVEVKKLTGEYVSPTTGRVTVGSLGPAWLERKQGVIKPSAYHSIESNWRLHVQPRWGGVQIGKIQSTDVQAWVTQLAGQLSASHVIDIHSVLARILDDAVKDRLVHTNRARGVNLPARTKKPNVYLTAGQLDALADEAGRYRSLVLLLGMVGLRWGEAAALRVGDIDFLRRRITLHRNAVRVGAETHVGTLKTGENRTVALPVPVVEALAKSCVGKDHGDLIWAGRDGGHLGPPSSHDSWLSGAVDRCITAADEQRRAERKAHPKRDPVTPVFPRVTAHALRHTAASLAISAGANVKAVQKMLGHASAAMTLDTYADLFDTDADAVADVMGRLWEKRAQSVPTDTEKADQ